MTSPTGWVSALGLLVALAWVVPAHAADEPSSPSPVLAPMPPPPPPITAGAHAPPPTTSRYVGLMYGFGPGVLALDLEVGLFYGFVSAPLPLDVFLHDEYLMGVVGAGVTFPVPRDPRWHFDVYAFGLPARSPLIESRSREVLSLGLGAGFHFTSDRGFTLGLKFPLFGSTFALDDRGMDDVRERAYAFYAHSALALPVTTFGYRF